MNMDTSVPETTSPKMETLSFQNRGERMKAALIQHEKCLG